MDETVSTNVVFSQISLVSQGKTKPKFRMSVMKQFIFFWVLTASRYFLNICIRVCFLSMCMPMYMCIYVYVSYVLCVYVGISRVVYDCVYEGGGGLCLCACMCVCGMCMSTLYISEMRFHTLGHKSGLPLFLSFRLTADSHLQPSSPKHPHMMVKWRPGQMGLVPSGLWEICSYLLKNFLEMDMSQRLGLWKWCLHGPLILRSLDPRNYWDWNNMNGSRTFTDASKTGLKNHTMCVCVCVCLHICVHMYYGVLCVYVCMWYGLYVCSVVSVCAHVCVRTHVCVVWYIL